MIKKKICILGAFAVGKTSLVERFVKSIFSDKYHSTIGVKTDQKDLVIGDTEIRLIIWDINGQDDHQNVRPSYLTGASAYFLVADGTRKETLKVVEGLNRLVENTIGEKSFYLLVNKSDLIDQWEIKEEDLQELEQRGWRIVKTSAKSGESVEDSFIKLATQLIEA